MWLHHDGQLSLNFQKASWCAVRKSLKNSATHVGGKYPKICVFLSLRLRLSEFLRLSLRPFRNARFTYIMMKSSDFWAPAFVGVKRRFELLSVNFSQWMRRKYFGILVVADIRNAQSLTTIEGYRTDHHPYDCRCLEVQDD